jgi:antitoxin ParD1/3/4
MNVSLPDPMKEWVEAQTATGRYANASDYVRDLIRKDQERAAKIAVMQQCVEEGLESGEPQDFSANAFLKAMRAKHGGKQT